VGDEVVLSSPLDLGSLGAGAEPASFLGCLPLFLRFLFLPFLLFAALPSGVVGDAFSVADGAASPGLGGSAPDIVGFGGGPPFVGCWARLGGFIGGLAPPGGGRGGPPAAAGSFPWSFASFFVSPPSPLCFEASSIAHNVRREVYHAN
jgi:hypothetical protein